MTAMSSSLLIPFHSIPKGRGGEIMSKIIRDMGRKRTHRKRKGGGGRGKVGEGGGGGRK